MCLYMYDAVHTIYSHLPGKDTLPTPQSDTSGIHAIKVMRNPSLSHRRISGYGINNTYNQAVTHLGMDSHADVSCAGKDAFIESILHGRSCNVKGFHDSYNTLSDIEYVNVLYKYLDETGQEYLLQINQCLNFTDTMENSILCTNQARHNGVLINDVPRIIDPKLPQCITFPKDDVHLPLLMNGPVPILPVMKPTPEEVETLQRLELTSDEVIW